MSRPARSSTTPARRCCWKCRAARLRLCSTGGFACRYFDPDLRAGVEKALADLLTILGGDNKKGHKARTLLCSTGGFACRYFDSGQHNDMLVRIRFLIVLFGGVQSAVACAHGPVQLRSRPTIRTRI